MDKPPESRSGHDWKAVIDAARDENDYIMTKVILEWIAAARLEGRNEGVEECARVECRFCQYGWVVERALKEHGGRFYHINPDDEHAPEYCLSQGIRKLSLPASVTERDPASDCNCDVSSGERCPACGKVQP